MKKVWITGENGFIAKNFQRVLGDRYVFENSLDNVYYDYWRQNSQFNNKEIDIFDPTLETLIERADVDFIIHAADSKRLNKPEHMLRTNVEGSYYIAQISKNLNIPVIYLHGLDTYFSHYYYNISKENALQILKKEGKVVSVSSSTVFGPFDFFNPIGRLIKSSVDNSIANIKVYSIEDKTSFVYIDDFLNALDLIIQNFHSINDEIRIVSSFSHSLEEVLEYFDFNDISIDFNIEEDVDGLCYTYREPNDSERYVQHYGWEEEYTLKSGLEEARRIWLN